MMEKPIAKRPEDIPALFVQAWSNRRADLLAALFTSPEADFVNVVGIWWETNTSIEKAHDYGFRVIFSQSELRLGKVKVKMLSEEIAVVHARMRLSGQTAKNEPAGLRNNLFLFVVKRFEEKWLCVSAQNTDIVPGAETHFHDSKGNLQSVSYQKH